MEATNGLLDEKRLCGMDPRLERLFKSSAPQLEPLPHTSIRTLPSMSCTKASTVSGNSSNNNKMKKKQSLQELMRLVGPQPTQDLTFSSRALSQVGKWMDLSGNKDACQVGKDCIQVLGQEFDESVQFLSQELHFLHSLFWSQNVPRQSAENCIQRGEVMVQLWRASHKVIWNVLSRLEQERERLREEGDPGYVQNLQMQITLLKKELDGVDRRIQELENTVEEYETFFDDLTSFQNGAQLAHLRQDKTALQSPTNLPLLLQHLYASMLRASEKPLSAPMLRLENSLKNISIPDNQDDLVQKERHESTPPPTTATIDNSAKSTRTTGEVVQVIVSLSAEPASNAVKANATVEDGKGNTQGFVTKPTNEEVSRTEEKQEDESKEEDAGKSKRFRRASQIMEKVVSAQEAVEKGLQGLDDIQQYQLIAKTLDAFRGSALRSMFSEMKEAGQRKVGCSLFESITDENAKSFIRDIMQNMIHDSGDRVDLIVKFVETLTQEEMDHFAVTLGKQFDASKLQSLLERISHPEERQKTSTTGSEKAVQTDGGFESSATADSYAERFLAKHATSRRNLGKSTKNFLATSKNLLSAIESKLLLVEEDALESEDQDEDGDGKATQASGSDSEDSEEDETDGSARQKAVSTLRNLMTNVDIENADILTKGGDISVKITLKRVDEPESERVGKLPWKKYLKKPTKGIKMRAIEKAQLENDIIGEVYMKKILTDKSLRSSKKTHSLAKSILHFFTQKYGLKKIAEEYLYGVVHAIRAYASESSRIELFGILVGIVDPEVYTPSLCDVVMEVLGGLFRPDLIGKFLGRGIGETWVQSLQATRAVRQAFRLVEGELLREKEQAQRLGGGGGIGSAGTSSGDETTPFEDTSARSWTIPGILRQRLTRWIEQNSVPLSEVDKSSGSDIKVIDCDLLLSQVAKTFMAKLKIDKFMIMNLFQKFDENKDGVLSFDEFTDLMNQCQPSPPLTEPEILDLWIEVNDFEEDEDDEKITPHAFAAVCISKNIELPYWKFDTVNLMNSLCKGVFQFNDDLAPLS